MQFSNADGINIVFNLIKVIQDNKQYLSDIDGLIGDGDHGINMNKGFTLCQEQLNNNPGDLSHGLNTLSKILMMKIGGSMGPLYGYFFKSMASACDGMEMIDAEIFGKMITSSKESIEKISEAKVGDKTLMDVLIPSEAAYQTALTDGKPFSECLEAMTTAAQQGRDSTKDLIAKVGRSSRLGERSRGVIDAGSASCCLILETFSTSIQTLLQKAS